jgi:hypothetical protein
MNKSILNSAIAAAMAIGLAACSSGSSDVAGIGGSGVTPSAVKSSGTITGFGSVYVNGVKYDTSSSTISIDDNPGVESDLAVGMRVTVNGTLIDDSNGTATSINFNDDLEGPVSNLVDVGNDGLIKTFTTLGRTVRISSDTTSFDTSGLPVPFDFSRIANDDHVEVSGFLDSNNVMIASRVELKDQTFNTSSIVEIKGTIETVNTTLQTFSLAGASSTSINYSGAVIDNNLPGGVAVDAFVEVKGQCPSTLCATVNASKVESGFDDFNDNDKVEVEGIITSLTDQDNFEINGIPVDASNNPTKIPASLTLAIDMEVEVEGSISNGTLIATKIKDESEDIKVTARVSDPAFSSDSFQVTPVSGQPPITVKVEKSTEVDDELGTITNSDNVISNLSLGDYISVEGYDDGSGTIIASEFEREVLDTNDRADVIVQGKLEEIKQDDFVKVLGVSFQIKDDPNDSANDETDFENALDVEIDQDAFIAAAPVGTLVKIKDRDESGVLNGIADEIEIELP